MVVSLADSYSAARGGNTIKIGPSIRRFLLVAPYLALMLVFFVAPIVVVVLRSLTLDGTINVSGGLSLDNYRSVLASEVLRGVLWRTLWIALLTTVSCFVLGFPTAYLISRLRAGAGAALMAMILLPFWVSVLVRLFALTTVLGRNGLVNSALSAIGLPKADLLFNTTATVIGMTNYLLPYMILILYSGMKRVDGNVLLAARSLGASPSQAFQRVFLPQMSAVILSGATLIFVLSLGFFLTPAVLGGSGDITVALYIQQQIATYRWGVASAIGVLLLIVSIAGYYVVIRLIGAGRMVEHTAGSKGSVKIESFRASPTTIVLWIMSLSSVALMLVPLAVTVVTSFGASRIISFPPQSLTLKWYAEIVEDPQWISAILKSLLVASATAVLSTFAALGLARVVHGLRTERTRSLIQAAVYAPIIVPVILLAIGMYDVQTRIGLQGSAIGLVLLHAVIAVPLSFAILIAALGSVDQSLELAARSLGCGAAEAFWKSTIPNIKGALIGAAVISFVTSWDEAVIALFQSDFEKTLPVLIFAYIQSGVEPVVPAIATVLILTVFSSAVLRLSLRKLVSTNRLPTEEV